MMAQIVKIQLGRLEKLLTDRHIELQLHDTAIEYLADRGYDPSYGARPLKRVIQSDLQNPLAERLLRGEITDGMTVRVVAKDGTLHFKGEKTKKQAA
jgi:ATP-dependent Clp protease ATP-binding subunit ClpB